MCLEVIQHLLSFFGVKTLVHEYHGPILHLVLLAALRFVFQRLQHDRRHRSAIHLHLLGDKLIEHELVVQDQIEVKVAVVVVLNLAVEPAELFLCFREQGQRFLLCGLDLT